MNNEPKLYGFEDYVVGDCNRFAFIAAYNLLNEPENMKWNPLLIWSSAGQGKTHLLKAMEKALIMNFPEKKIKYITADEFTNEFVSTIKNGQYDDFRNKYRTLDYLLFDDIDSFENKNGVQTEFYNTVVALLDNGKHLVVTTNRIPRDLDNILDPTLLARLISGVVFEMEPPDPKTRRKIAQRIIDREGVKIDKFFVDFICDRPCKNVRRFICVMNIVCEYIKLFADDKVDIENIEMLLAFLEDGFKKREITVDLIINTVADYFGCSRYRIVTGPNSYKKNYQRMVAIAVCEDLLDISSERLEKYFGLTVSRGRILRLTSGDPAFEKDVEFIKEKLLGWAHGTV